MRNQSGCLIFFWNLAEKLGILQRFLAILGPIILLLFETYVGRISIKRKILVILVNACFIFRDVSKTETNHSI